MKTFGLKKSLGIGLTNIWSRKKVSVSVSKILVSKKSLGIGLDEIFWSRHSVLICSAAFAILAMLSIQIVQLNFTFSARKSLTDTDLHSPVVPDPFHFTYFVVDN